MIILNLLLLEHVRCTVVDVYLLKHRALLIKKNGILFNN